jgi:formylglycine-generating enzyme required for sulfatase activity
MSQSEARRSSGNVTIENLTIVKGSGKLIEIRFDASWASSFRRDPDEGAGNWDAAWIFVKYTGREKRELSVKPTVIHDLNVGRPGTLLDALRGPKWKPLSSAVAGLDDEADHRVTLVKRGHWILHQDSDVPMGEPITDTFEVKREKSPRGKLPKLVVSSRVGTRHARIVEVVEEPDGGVVDLSEDHLGIFLRRHDRGEGPARYEGITLRCRPEQGWPFAADEEGKSKISLAVFGVEMIYVPESPFHLGDPEGKDGPPSCFWDVSKEKAKASAGGKVDRTYEVTSEAAIPLRRPGHGGGSALTFLTTTTGSPGDPTGTIPAAYPKGFGAFYLMRCQVTQRQYADFVNTLHGPGRTSRYSYWTESFRYSVYMTSSDGWRVVGRPDRACNWLSWMDGMAYAAWAGLRPMTELEFEKACRGPAPPVAKEYAWGTTQAVRAEAILGSESDGRFLATGNASFDQRTFMGGDGGAGPLPGDAFGAAMHNLRDFIYKARPAGWEAPLPNARERSGASYYGVMGLSGNLWELCVTAGDKEGRSFTGEHGKGRVDLFGTPDCKALGWPGADAKGMGARGGSWYTPKEKLMVADRSMGTGLQGYTSRAHDLGFRAARTAPKRK